MRRIADEFDWDDEDDDFFEFGVWHRKPRGASAKSRAQHTTVQRTGFGHAHRVPSRPLP